MATSVKVINNLPKFSKVTKVALNNALNELARDLLIDAKNTAPFLSGGLRSDSGVKTPKPLSKEVYFGKEYAAYQEFGGDGKKRVQNYTTAGTGKKFLSKSGDKQSRRGTMVIKKHANLVKV